MATPEAVQWRIFWVEGFQVVIRRQGGRPMPRNMTRWNYGYREAAPGAMTVREWKRERFATRYPDYACDVLDGRGFPAADDTTLIRLRDRVLEE